jgi:hypothetical protein
MTPLETYLRELRDIRSSGAAVKETSYYPALSNLLNEVGKSLKPRVRCIINLANRGAGLPDGGLFTAEQFQKPSEAEPLPGQPPARGVIEVKPTKDDAWVTADGEQVSRYWGKYRQVLVTNYRDFVLVGQDAEGKFAKLEPFHLADSEKAFWAGAVHPRSLAEKIGTRFEDYLLRVMRHAAQLAAPEDVAWFLGSYARDAKARIEGVELAALATVRTALEEALGLKFEGKKGEHFFRSSLVQTLFYGVFSAWVLWAKQNPPTSKARFDWRTAAWYLRVPMISRLFQLVADPQELEALKLTEVLQWSGLVLNRVERRTFFDNFQESHAVQYFYEPFLEAFDPELRKELGVWYTPPEIVKYMVERVDTVLREELNLPDGLADKNVYVLDPCCGTGSYLVEVLDRIHRTLKERGQDALTASDLKEAAQNRVFGFEILPAPFVVSHLQLGLLLQNLGVPLSEKGKERARVYLTNALTGWEPPKGPKKQLAFWELQEERDAAEHVKREVPILVILGNPPYNAFAGVSPQEEQGLVEPYKEGLISEWGIKKFNLDDLYIRFFRLAERRIAEMTGKGVVSFISNHSWLSDPSFVVMREHLLASFGRFWIENMHGNRKISEYAPDGRTSETIFAIPGFSVGIQQGVAISLWVKGGKPAGTQQVLFRDDLDSARAVERRAQLLDSLGTEDLDSHYRPARPDGSNRYSFRPQVVAAHYKVWPTVAELSAVRPTLGILENRRDALISVDAQRLRERMEKYFDQDIDWETLDSLKTGLTLNAARFDAKNTRQRIVKSEKFDPNRVLKCMIRPFDTRWCYYSSFRPLWNEPRPDLWEQYSAGSSFFVTRRKGVASPEGVPFFFTRTLGTQHSLNTDAYYVALGLPGGPVVGDQSHLYEARNRVVRNLSPIAQCYLSSLGIENVNGDSVAREVIWTHALAIGYSPAYLSENADGIRQDWPRIPLPDTKEALLASAALGKQIAALLDTETEAEAVRDPALQRIAEVSRVGGGELREKDEGDLKSELAVTAGWGHAGKGGVTMPGKGKIIERDYNPAERDAFVGPSGARPEGERRSPLLGGRTCDVYLNDTAYWSNVPLRVWEYTIGGYQVMKKWLSYREEKLLGRPLTKEEVRYVQEMARRIAAILLLEPALDANYQNVKAHTFPWKG